MATLTPAHFCTLSKREKMTSPPLLESRTKKTSRKQARFWVFRIKSILRTILYLAPLLVWLTFARLLLIPKSLVALLAERGFCVNMGRTFACLQCFSCYGRLGDTSSPMQEMSLSLRQVAFYAFPTQKTLLLPKDFFFPSLVERLRGTFWKAECAQAQNCIPVPPGWETMLTVRAAQTTRSREVGRDHRGCDLLA